MPTLFSRCRKRGTRHFLNGLVCAANALACAVLLPATPVTAWGQACTTTITGKVYSPNNIDPLPNILVYVPTGAVDALPAGPQSCAVQATLVKGTPLVSTTTAADGTFSITNPGLAGTNVPLVIQAGKWRRQLVVPTVTACATTTFNTRMPQNQSEGDIPSIAISTGGADALECVLRKIGISDSEFNAPGGAGRINLYRGSGAPGVTVDAAGTALPSETALMSTQSTINSYDLAMFACQGTPANPAAASPIDAANLVNYANIGGRVFATHYSYVWLEHNGPFDGVAKWTYSNSSPTLLNTNATIDQSYAEGKILAQWLQDIGATTTLGQLPLQQTKYDLSAVIPPTQSWITLNEVTAAYNNPVMQFTFDTPINDAATPTVTIGFANSPTTFLEGDAADNIAINVTNTSAAAADTTLNLKLGLPSGLTAVNLGGVNGNSGWICSTPTLTCNRTVPLPVGASDPLALVVSVAANAPVDTSTVTATLGGGGLSGTGQCGRVLFNDYHVEGGPLTNKFPTECNATAMTPQEKFLEFSLYNLSNFVGPTSDDTITIQGIPKLTWATPAPILYGTPLSATQLNATASVPGTFVYTPAAGAVEPVGTTTLSVVFTPTDTVGYQSVTATVQLQVVPQTTNTTDTNVVSPIFYGQIIADAALETVIGTLGGGVDGGTLNFLIDGVVVCALPANIAGVCPPPTGSGYSAGTHGIQSVYTGDTNFAPSSSPIYNVVVQPDPTATALASSLTPAVVGQAVTLTATVADQYITAVGPVQFLDGTNVIGTSQVNATGVAKLVTSTLFVGTHSLTACFLASLNYNGSCSSPVSQVISTVPAAPLATVTLLSSSLNPSVVGQSVTFTAVTQTTGAFVQVPTGSVSFLDGTATLGTVALDATGKAAYSTTTLKAGTHPITASYTFQTPNNGLPLVTFAPSVSTTLSQVVTTGIGSAGYGFVMSVTPTTISTGVGVSSVMSVTVTDLNGFNSPVQLACAGLPYETSCSFAQATIPAGGGTTALVVSPQSPRPCSAVASNESGTKPGLPLLAIFGVAAFFARRRRRLLQGMTLGLVVCLLPLALMLNGCSTGCADFGTQPGYYTFTITGTAPNGVTPVTTTASGSAALTQTQTVIMKVVP